MEFLPENVMAVSHLNLHVLIFSCIKIKLVHVIHYYYILMIPFLIPMPVISTMIIFDLIHHISVQLLIDNNFDNSAIKLECLEP